MKLEQWPIDDVIPYARNPRHNADAVAKVAASIQEFGWRQPIVVDADRVIIVGHTRLLAARQLGYETVPVHVADNLTPAQVKAYRLADNRTHEDSSWDRELLALELEDLQAGGFDLGSTGFDEDELNDLLCGRTSGLTDPDELPEVSGPPVTVPGDIWVLGRHRLVCGDATSADAVAALLGDVRPHLMVTDPPYGVNYDPAWRGRVLNAKPGATGKVLNDDRADWREAWALFPGDVAYVWHGGLHAPVVAESLSACRFRLRAQIVWVKTNRVMSRGHYHWQHEPCFYAVREEAEEDFWRFVPEHEVLNYAVREGATARWSGDRKQSTVWFIEHLKNDTGHGTQKPMEAMRRPIENNSSPGHAVYDPFCGSGTTIIACETNGRSCLAMELAPEYCDLAVQRWQNFTGQAAQLEASGQDFAAVQAERAPAEKAKRGKARGKRTVEARA